MTDPWVCYILECADGTLYTGITTEIARRLRQHNEGVAARYTRSRRPVRLLWTEEWADRSGASRREREVKRLDRAAKLALVQGAGTSPRPGPAPQGGAVSSR